MWPKSCLRAPTQLLVEAETADGARHSIILQNAETVRLVGPAAQVASGAAAQRASDREAEKAPLAPVLEFEADPSSGDDDADAALSGTAGKAAVISQCSA